MGRWMLMGGGMWDVADVGGVGVEGSVDQPGLRVEDEEVRRGGSGSDEHGERGEAIACGAGQVERFYETAYRV
jgi:hypothetical protein